MVPWLLIVVVGVAKRFVISFLLLTC